jgi:thiamine pyrophosphate-dependent acetolactate synthase large subunit-like protein
VEDAAARLLRAQSPVIVADRYAHDQTGMDLLVQLAELLQAPVIDQQGRLNFPTDHYLNHSQRAGTLVRNADVVLGLEVNDIWGTLNQLRDRVHRDEVRRARADAHVITISSELLYLKSNYQDLQRYYPVDNSIAGNAQATLPALIEAIRRKLARADRSRIAGRETQLRDDYERAAQRSLAEAGYGWDASPITTARLYSDLWEAIKDEDWGLVSVSNMQSRWPQRLCPMQKYHQYIGWSGGAGLGYGLPAAVGAALAHREHGRLAINVQADGDMMFVPGALWTAAHHEIPLLTIMHNNGGYHQELMHLQRMAARRQRGIDGSAKIGNVFEDPSIDYGGLARSMGVWAGSPVTDPAELAPALSRALEVVAAGEPALVDVVCQPR